MRRERDQMSHIDSFSVGSTEYEHVLFFNSDDRVECRDQDGTIVLTHTSDCKVLMPNGDLFGRWSTDATCNWTFESSSGDTVLTYGRDLLMAEVEVSILFIEGSIK